MTPGANAVSQFSTLANLDCNGCPAYANCSSDMASDSQESGLEAAQLALTSPLSIDTLKTCTKDSDCTSDPNLCGDPKTCPYSCWQGTCGGWNKDFLRDDAQLEIVVLSDEDDQSPSGLPFYIDFFKNIKGFYNVGMMHLHAIVWQDSGCPTPPSSQGTGDRYIKAAQETNGQIGNICDSDYGPIMDKIGISAFQPKVQFFLTRLADPPTVTVKVDDAACATGWKYDSNSNSVVFDVNGTCMPQPGQKIDIHYKTLCLTS